MDPSLLSSSINILEGNKSIAWTNASYKTFTTKPSPNFFEKNKVTYSIFNQEELISELVSITLKWLYHQ